MALSKSAQEVWNKFTGAGCNVSMECKLDSEDMKEVMSHNPLMCNKCFIELYTPLNKKSDFDPWKHIPSLRAIREAEQQEAHQKAASEALEKLKQTSATSSSTTNTRQQQRQPKDKVDGDEMPAWKVHMDKVKAYVGLYGLTKKQAEARIRREEADERRKTGRSTKTQPATLVEAERMPWTPRMQFYKDRRSNLTFEEHRRFVAMLLSIRQTGALRHSDQKQEFEELQRQFEEEQQQFSDYIVSLVAETKNAKLGQTMLQYRMSNCPPFATKLYKIRMVEKSKHLADDSTEPTYQQFATPIELLKQTSDEQNRSKLMLRLEAFVAETGKRNKVSIPSDQFRATISNDTDAVLRKYPVEHIMKSINTDEQALRCARVHNTPFVMSASVARMLCVMSSPLRGRAFELPLHVRYEVVQGKASRVFVFGKPLPPRHVTSSQQFYYYCKYALRDKLIDLAVNKQKMVARRKQPGVARAAAAESVRTVSSYEDITESTQQPSLDNHSGVDDNRSQNDEQNDNDGEDSDSDVGVSPRKQSPKKLSNAEIGLVDSSDNEEETDRLKIDDEQEQSDREKEKQKTRTFPEKKSRTLLSQSDWHEDKAPSRRRSARLRQDTNDLWSQDATPRRRRKVSTKADKQVEKVDDIEKTARSTRKAAETESTTETTMTPDTSKPNESVLDTIMQQLNTNVTGDQSGGFGETHSPSNQDVNDQLKAPNDDWWWRYGVWLSGDHRILIRSKISGETLTASTVKGTKIAQQQKLKCTMLPRMEYFPEHGAECLSNDELLWHYLTWLLSGSDQHSIYRINANFNVDGSRLDIVGTEHLRAQQFLEKVDGDVTVAEFLTQCMSRFNDLLDQLMKLQLSSREYILALTGDNPDQVQVMQAMIDAEPCALDLRTAFTGPISKVFGTEPPDPSTLRYNGVDGRMVLHWHRVKSRVPATFMPVGAPGAVGASATGKQGSPKKRKAAGADPSGAVGSKKSQKRRKKRAQRKSDNNTAEIELVQQQQIEKEED